MHFLPTLIVQIAVVLAAAWLVGLAFRKIRQPQVVGEMVAGILLGPSLLGWVAPGVSAVLFPPESLGYLNALSQVGLLLFMFLIGLELDPKLLRGHRHTALVTSHVSIVVPFFLGALLALYLYPRLADERVAFTGFALFMGAAMSVTAFPVLARIMTERNLLRTRVGVITIACAAVDDVTAWCILAVVIAVVRAGEAVVPLWLTVAGSLVYVGVMLFPVRRALTWLEKYYHTRGKLTRDMIIVVLLLLLASAWTTEWLGIHALFGAFVIGAVMPKDRGFVHDLTGKFEDVAVAFLLPLFFAYTGLRTSIGLVQGAEMWLFCALILLVAVTGKFGGSAFAARATGLTWREAGALGVMMNTRGLMELVILTIGLDLGVISPALFAMMVIMALVTTFMTTPLLEWIYPARLIRQETIGEAEDEKQYTALIPVSLPSSGPGLLRVAVGAGAVRVYALHLIRPTDRSLAAVPVPERPGENEALRPLLDAAAAAVPRPAVRPLAFLSRDAAADIVDVTHTKGADLILMGWHKPVLGASILGGTVHDVMHRARADVAVYVERHYRPWRRILVPYRDGVHDRGALALAHRLARHSDAELTILHVVSPEPGPHLLRATPAEELFADEHVRLQVVESDAPLDVAVEVARQDYDLVVIGVSEEWGLEPAFFGTRHERLAQESPASLVMLRRYVQETKPTPVPAGAAAAPRPVARPPAPYGALS